MCIWSSPLKLGQCCFNCAYLSLTNILSFIPCWNCTEMSSFAAFIWIMQPHFHTSCRRFASWIMTLLDFYVRVSSWDELISFFTFQTTFKGRVFMTHATKAIYKLLLSDFVKVSKVSVEDMLYTEQDINKSMDRIEACYIYLPFWLLIWPLTWMLIWHNTLLSEFFFYCFSPLDGWKVTIISSSFKPFCKTDRRTRKHIFLLSFSFSFLNIFCCLFFF